MSRAVLLDIDGTLVDSTYHHAMAWHRAFLRHDVTLPVWRLHRTIGMGGDRLVTEVAGQDVEDRMGDQVREAWREEYAAVVDDVPALPGAAELVRRLAERGYVVALSSSGETEFSRKAVETLGIGDLVAVTTSSDDASTSKPAPDILTATLAKLDGVERAVFVGDTPYDVEAAQRIGLHCLGVLSGGFSVEELTTTGAVRVVEELTELVDDDWDRYLAVPKEEAS